MFMPPSAPRSRPLFAVSLAAHAALLAALAVPPLLATPEPPEPEVRMVPFFPITTVQIGAAAAPSRQNFLRKGNDGSVRASAPRANEAAARPPALTQPSARTNLLPPPTGEQTESPFEEAGEPGGPSGGTGESEMGGRGGCESCNPISAEAPGVTPPVALESAVLAYPELARRARIEGVVVLEAIIGADGSVRDVRVLRGAHSLLDPAALEAVRRWRYRPARIGERPVAVYLKVVMTFSLRNL